MSNLRGILCLICLLLAFQASCQAKSPILSGLSTSRPKRVFDDGAPLNWQGLSSQVTSFANTIQNFAGNLVAQNSQMIDRLDRVIERAKATGNWVCAIETEFGERRNVCRAIDPVTQKALVTQSELLGDPTAFSSIF